MTLCHIIIGHSFINLKGMITAVVMINIFCDKFLSERWMFTKVIPEPKVTPDTCTNSDTGVIVHKKHELLFAVSSKW